MEKFQKIKINFLFFIRKIDTTEKGKLLGLPNISLIASLRPYHGLHRCGFLSLQEKIAYTSSRWIKVIKCAAKKRAL